MPRSWRILIGLVLTILGLWRVSTINDPIAANNNTLAYKLSQQFPYDVTSAFPSTIWQTWKYSPKEKEFLAVEHSSSSWSIRNPDHAHNILSDLEAEYFLKEIYNPFPEILEAYDALPLPVLKADFFRYLILLAKGGIYTDIDTAALKPVSEWIPDTVSQNEIGIVVGIEADPDREDWHKWYSRRVQFCQWTMLSKPGHPILVSIVSTITRETLQLKSLNTLTPENEGFSVIEFTGPAIWTDTIFDHLNGGKQCATGGGGGLRAKRDKTVSWRDFTGITSQVVVSDVMVLPITSFSPGVGHMGSKGTNHEMAFVKHEFSGSWKEEDKK